MNFVFRSSSTLLFRFPRRFVSGSSKPNAKTGYDQIFKKFVLRVHPDFFHAEPARKDCNQLSLQQLNEFLAAVKGDQLQSLTGKRFDVTFFVRHVQTEQSADTPPPAAFKISAAFEAAPQRATEGHFTFNKRIRQSVDAFVQDLLLQAGVLRTALMQNAEVQTAHQNLTEAFWADTDQPANAKEATEMFRQALHKHMKKNTFLTLEFERLHGRKLSQVEPAIRMQHLMPLLHEDSVFSPLLTNDEKMAAIAKLRLHLVELCFDQWCHYPVMLLLPPDHPRKSEEADFLIEFGNGYVQIPIDFDNAIKLVKNDILASLPIVQQHRKQQTVAAHQLNVLLRAAGDTDLDWTSISVEAPLLKSLPALRLLAACSKEQLPSLVVRTDNSSLVANVHLSIVSSDDPLHVDILRQRVCVPANLSDLATLQRFFASSSTQFSLRLIQAQIQRAEQTLLLFGKLSEALRLALGLHCEIYLDQALTRKTAQWLPGVIDKTEKGTAVVPFEHGPALASHTKAQRSVLRRATLMLESLLLQSDSMVRLFKDDCPNVVLVLSDHYEVDFVAPETRHSKQQPVVLAQRDLAKVSVPIDGEFDIEELRKLW